MVFSGRLSRSRKLIECSFGIMLSNQTKCGLHNFIKSLKSILSRRQGNKEKDSKMELSNEEPQRSPGFSN